MNGNAFEDIDLKDIALETLPGTLTALIPGVAEHRADLPLALASVGKLLLLTEVARSFANGTLNPDEPLELLPEDYCEGSGLLTKLSPRTWTLQDLARLTASISDNTATNALLRRLGLDRINHGTEQLGLHNTRILDKIREPRRPTHPPTFAIGTARELAVLATMAGGPEPWAALLLGWMASCTDRTMVPALIPHDPEDDAVRETGELPLGHLWVANKTGTDAGTRCDVGIVRGSRQVVYAVLTACEPGREFEMIQAMRCFGRVVGAAAAG